MCSASTMHKCEDLNKYKYNKVIIWEVQITAYVHLERINLYVCERLYPDDRMLRVRMVNICDQ